MIWNNARSVFLAIVTAIFVIHCVDASSKRATWTPIHMRRPSTKTSPSSSSQDLSSFAWPNPQQTSVQRRSNYTSTRRSSGSTKEKKRKVVRPHSDYKKPEQEEKKSLPLRQQEPVLVADVSSKEIIGTFLSRDSRQFFIGRVYAILSVQLIVTALSCCAFGLMPQIAAVMKVGKGKIVPLVALGMSTLSWFHISRSPSARRYGSMKWKLLALFTIGEAISVGFISSLYKFQSVAIAMGTTALATLCISAYTLWQKDSRYDLSQFGSSLSSTAMIFLVYGLIGTAQTLGWIPFNFIPYNQLIFSALSASLVACFLAYNTKLIVGGKYSKYQMNEQDYVFGAMALYSDIINLFISVLQVVGFGDNDDDDDNDDGFF